MTVSVKIMAAAAALVLLACGCDTSSPAQTGTTTTAATSAGSTKATTAEMGLTGIKTSTSATGATKFTRPSLTTKSTTRLTVTQGVPTARQLLGITYGNLLDFMDNTYYVVNQRGHMDVTCALVNREMLPHYEILDAGSAFKDWQYGVSLIDTQTAGQLDAIQTSQVVTGVYVTQGGQLTSKIKVGQTLKDMKRTWASMPDMTITYDFSGVFNKSYYGYLAFTAENCQIELFVDLTTSAAKKALAGKKIVLGEGGSPSADPNMGKTVSLPELTVSAAILRLRQQG